MPPSTLFRTVSTATRLHVSCPSTKGLRFARLQHLPSSLPVKRPYYTVALGTTTTRKPRSRIIRFLGVIFLLGFGFSTGIYRGTAKVMQQVKAPVMTDEETLAGFIPQDEVTQMIEDHIQNHPLAQSLREDPAYTGSRPHLKIPEKFRARSLTAGTLAIPKGIAVPPLVFANKETQSMVSLFYLGPNLSGHPGIVHGGLLATLLDEGMGRTAFLALPNKVGVTANLNVDYRRPAMADSYFVLRAHVVKSEGRKAWVEARIETLPEEGQEPEVLVEGKSLFIEPKMASGVPGLQKFAN
ncbi:HotDog domain-containing protein [Aspergillus karnatakaensis]|uniref:PaaI family thioesterase n=1 Tax=Aspergillus karnatakaensis TaxID=1810916 RepID=UPI003CCDFB70